MLFKNQLYLGTQDNITIEIMFFYKCIVGNGRDHTFKHLYSKGSELLSVTKFFKFAY